MTINLSEEMIEKITCVSFGRVRELGRKIEEAEQMEDSTQREHAKKMIYLKDLNKALKDAKEVHGVFLEMLESKE